jgi:hypothetical protein
MKLLPYLPALFAIGLGSYLFIRSFRRTRVVDIGGQLFPKEHIPKLYRHDLKVTRCLERVLDEDRVIPILSDEVRAEAERLVKAFYNDKGD